MKTIVVYNPKSGSALSKSAIRKIFNDSDIEISDFVPIADRYEVRLKKAISKDTIVAVIGGDGTISSSAGVIIDCGAILLPLPGGTKNNFTKDLGVPQDISDALRAAAQAKVRSIDIASVNHHYFVNNSSIGLYPASLIERAKVESVITKWPAAVVGALKALYRFRVYRLDIDGATYKTPFVFIGNNAYNLFDGTFGRRDSLISGELFVAILTTSSRRQMLAALIATMIRRNISHDGIEIIQTDTITIASKKARLRVAFDGEEQLLQTPLQYELHAKKLKVLA